MRTQSKMKKLFRITNPIFPVALFGVFILLSGCADSEKIAKYEQQHKELLAEKVSLENALNEKDEAINEFMALLGEIEENLTTIKEKEQVIEMKKNDPELADNGKEGIVKDIQLINTMMEENRKMMAFMKEKLNKAGLKVASFEKKITQLNKKMDLKDEAIQLLKEDLTTKDFEIAQLNNVVDTLSGQVEKQKEFIHKQEDALNTTYFAKGTYKELKENGVIETSGLIPWADRNKQLSDEVIKGQFEKVDVREFTTVPINSTKADLITKHPEGTYEFTESEQGQIASLDITNPDEFWKLSNYLVVEVK